MKDFLIEINKENGTNYKIEILKKYKKNELVKKVLKMTYDKVNYIYGVSIKKIEENSLEGNKYDLNDILNILEKEFVTRKITGNKAKERLQEIYNNTSLFNKNLLLKIIDRDLKIGIGVRILNKIYKNLIPKPLYMRCSLFSKTNEKKKGTIENISFPAYIQLKADGTYREMTINENGIHFLSRSGEPYSYPYLEKELKDLPYGKYIGELRIKGTKNRQESNGLINSDNIPEEKLIFELWDYLELEEYEYVKLNKNGIKTYEERWKKLNSILQKISSNNLFLIPSYEINNVKEALEKVHNWMKEGLEGGILKDKKAIYKDGTSKYQLKLKLEIDADVRITGFTEGKKGTSREKYFGAITYETDDGKVKGQTSGFKEKELKDFSKRKDELIGKIMTIQFNDITKSKNNEYYALSHPRFISIREDKEKTDTLERIKESKQMAMNL